MLWARHPLVIEVISMKCDKLIGLHTAAELDLITTNFEEVIAMSNDGKNFRELQDRSSLM
jgi:hypothetical protein